MIPREEDQRAVKAVTDSIVPGDFIYKSLMMEITSESSMFGMILTKVCSKSDLLTEGMNWIKVKSSITKGKDASTRKKDACAAYTVISSLVYLFPIIRHFLIKSDREISFTEGFFIIFTCIAIILRHWIRSGTVTFRI